MNEIIARCGLKCSECGAHITTKDDDDEKRKEVAAEWSKKYKADIRPENINCDGCLSTGTRIFSHCNVCEIRKCGIEKDLTSCAHCEDYTCEKILGFFEMVSDAKKTLDRIKASIG